MKKSIFFLLISSWAIFSFADNERLKPYILAGIEKGENLAVAEKVEAALNENGFTILGIYSPMNDSSRSVMIASHDLLTGPVKKFGGLYAFAAIIRFGFYKNGDNIEVSYTNPLYWGNAIYREKFPDVEKNYDKLTEILAGMFDFLSDVKNLPYGSKEGLKISKLRKYHYMAFMPYMDDVVKLAKNTDYESVLKKIEENFSKKIGGVEKVYRLDFPGNKLTLFGGALFGVDGESKFIPKIDKKDPRHISFMPYEFLVMKDAVVMLHGRFRIALSFPDLSMGTFMKIVSTPGNIADYFRDIVNK
jgi:hypothetical protein